MPIACEPLLAWWFGHETSPAAAARAQNALWFGKADAQDREARERFGEWVEQALAGGLTEWDATPQGWLARVLLLDQLPRMIHRDTPRAFEGDALAQHAVREGLRLGRDEQLPPLQRTFIYLVLEHAENLDTQNEAVQRFDELLTRQPSHERDWFVSSLDYARRHQAVIARFGRFPHRNDILGRKSTAEELEFLKQPGSRF